MKLPYIFTGKCSNLYLRSLSFAKPYRKEGLYAALCTLGASATIARLPMMFIPIVDDVLAAKSVAQLFNVAIGIVLLFLLRGVLLYGQSYLMSYIGQHIVTDIREAVFSKIQKLSTSFFDKNKTGAIMSYVTNDVAVLQSSMVDNLVQLVTEGTILLASVFTMIYLDWELFVLSAIIFPPVIWFIDWFGKKIRKSGHWIQEASADLNSVLQENVVSSRVIKSFVREDYEISRFKEQNLNTLRANMKNAQQTSILTPVIEFVAACGVAVVLWWGGNNVIDGKLTSGEFVAFLSYAVNSTNPIKRLSKVIGNIQKSLAAAQRVFDILDMPEEVTNKDDATILPPVKGTIEFKNVSFGYNNDEIVLKNLSFTAKPGQMIALVGPSGSGKSTIANLLPRFYDVKNGAVVIDNHDVKDVTMESLRNQIGIVPQETVLFNGNVYDNILYGRLDATKDEVIAAAKAANAHDFIMELPQGYDTMLGDRGLNISGGQRQRLAIARAILKNPQILILDEATSALDTESERIVQDALDRLMVGRTSFVVAHRLSTIKNADKILVLDKGMLVEEGSHEELLALKGLYAHLYNIQYSKDVSVKYK